MSPIRSTRSSELSANGHETREGANQTAAQPMSTERYIDLMMTRLGQQKNFAPMTRERILSSW